MDVSELHGFLTAVITGPLVMPSEWLPYAWGGEPNFSSPAQAERMTGLVMRMNNEISLWLAEEPDNFEPLFYENVATKPPITIAESWCYGYMRGIALRANDWQWVFDDDKLFALLTPINIFARVDDPTTNEILENKQVFEELTNAVTPCAAGLYRAWKEKLHESYPSGPIQKADKVGPNAPCPCGSGKKFKRCCGSPLRTV